MCALGHNAEPAAGLEGVMQGVQIPGGLMQVFEDFGGGDKLLGSIQGIRVRMIDGIV